MPEENEIIEQTQVETPKVELKNPFDDTSWQDSPIKTQPNITDVENETSKEQVSNEEIVDEDYFFTKEFGVKKDDLKKEWDELKQLKGKQPEPLKFANEESEKYFTSIKEGKEDEIYNYLSEKKRFEKLEKANLSKPHEAEEVYKMSLKYKNKELEPDEIDFLFNKRFAIPPKPTQTDDMLDGEYEQAIASWEKQVKLVEKELTIEAKLLKPELAKYKSELVLPDIPKQAPQSEQPSQESLAAAKAAREQFLSQLESDYKKFDGFTAKVKDESVEIPVSFNVPEEDRVAVKKLMENFDQNEFFSTLWMNKDGTVNVNKMQADLYLLSNREKVFQGLVNNAASQRLIQDRKTKSNIKLDTGSNNTTFKPETKDAVKSQVDYLFANS